MKEKKIVITDEGIHVMGYGDTELLAVLVQAVVSAYHRNMGPLNEAIAGKRIIDMLDDCSVKEKVNILFGILSGREDE